MPTPTAIVTVTLTGISGIDASGLSGATNPYFLATIQGRRIGRSSAIPTSATSFDFTAQPEAWSFEVPVGASDTVAVSLSAWDDKGDEAGAQLVTVSASVAPPWLPGSATATGPNGEVLSYTVATVATPDTSGAAPVPRVADGTDGLATLIAPDVVVLEISDILGLWQPTGDTTNPSATVVGYRSEDDLGRIFLHRDYAKNWVAHHHQIEIGVNVTALLGQVPPDAKVKWTVIDPDDPTNDDPGFHGEWGPVIDKNDYDASGNLTGACQGDNQGTRAGDTFVEVPGFSISSVTATTAETAIVGGVSRVTFTGTNVAGDNFIVIAELDTTDSATVLRAQTGIMTMWHQINVEYREMAGAFPLDVDQVPPFFEPACVQLDFSRVDSPPLPDTETLAANDDQFRQVVDQWVTNNFTHNGQAGWFCMMAARNAYPPPAPVPEPVPDGWPTVMTKLWWNGYGWDHQEWFDVPGDFPQVVVAIFDWNDPDSGDARRVKFTLDRATPWVKPDGTHATRCFIGSSSHDMTHDFAASDGSVAHATQHRRMYFPQGYVTEGGSFVSDQGYRVPHDVQVTVQGKALFIAGISPPLSSGGQDFFAGRTVIFTHHRAFATQAADGTWTKTDRYPETVIVMVHELTHAFGMPHICGYWDWRTPRATTCAMNYPLNWMRNYTTKKLDPNSDSKASKDLCPLHLREVRKTDMTKNTALHWT